MQLPLRCACIVEAQLLAALNSLERRGPAIDPEPSGSPKPVRRLDAHLHRSPGVRHRPYPSRAFTFDAFARSHALISDAARLFTRGPAHRLGLPGSGRIDPRGGPRKPTYAPRICSRANGRAPGAPFFPGRDRRAIKPTSTRVPQPSDDRSTWCAAGAPGSCPPSGRRNELRFGLAAERAHTSAVTDRHGVEVVCPWCFLATALKRRSRAASTFPSKCDFDLTSKSCAPRRHQPPRILPQIRLPEHYRAIAQALR